MLRTGDGVPKRMSDTMRGDARAAPAVGQGRAEGLQQDVAVVVVHAHVRAVQGLDDHAVDAQRRYGLVPPDALPPARGRDGASTGILPGA